MNTAKKLLQFGCNGSVFGQRAFRVRGSQTSLEKQSEILKEIEHRHRGGMHKGARREDIKQTFRRFIQASNSKAPIFARFNTRTLARKLAWALTYCEKQPPYDRTIASNARDLEIALEIIEAHGSRSGLLGVFDALLRTWGRGNARLLRTYVRNQLSGYSGRRSLIRNLKSNMDWYCNEQGATQLAMKLLRTKTRLADVWTYLELPDHVHGYPYFGYVAKAYIDLMRTLNRTVVEDIVQFVEMHNDDGTTREVLSKVIERLGSDAFEYLRQPVQSYVLRNWQDPRLSSAKVHWRGVSDNAQRIFERWITREDLRLFFDIVAKSCNDEKFKYRKAFWMSYLEHISFCRPILRKDVETILRNDPEAMEYYQTRQPATLKGGSLDQHAFIIWMREHTFVEFSTAGACYVYSDESRPFRLDATEYHMSDFRRSDNVHRVIHSGSGTYAWQRRFRNWIESNLRIKQSGDYWIEDDSRFR